MFRLKNDAFLSKAKKGGTLGGWFEDIKTRDSVQNMTIQAQAPETPRLFLNQLKFTFFVSEKQ